jgi:hypothetical protein
MTELHDLVNVLGLLAVSCVDGRGVEELQEVCQILTVVVSVLFLIESGADDGRRSAIVEAERDDGAVVVARARRCSALCRSSSRTIRLQR